MNDCAHFSRDPSLWEELTQMLWGSHDICTSLSWFQLRDVTQLEFLALSCAGAWGDTEKPQCDMVYPLIVPGKTIEGEMAFRLAMVWAHPHHACLPSLDEAVRKLALLIDIGNDWAYTFVQLNEGALHVSLSSEGHTSAMINGALSRSACRHLCQLQVQKLLQCRSYVLCLEGLNRGLEPVQLSVPQPPMWDTNTLGRSAHESLFLQVDLSWAMPGDKMPLIPGPCKASIPPSSPHLVAECPSDVANCTSMAAEFQELLSQMVLDTSGPASGDRTLRRQISAVWVSPLTIREEDLFRLDRSVSAMSTPMVTSQQALVQTARLDEAIPISHLPSLTLVSETPKVASVLPPCNPGLILGQT